jgi:hypothetical protein
MRPTAVAYALTAVIAASCAATRSGPSKVQLEYMSAHPLSPPERQRLAAREAQRGDTIDRVRVTFDDCDWDRQRVDGDVVVWRVHVPIDARAIRVVTDALEEVTPGGAALLTFEHDRLKSILVL